MSTSDQDRATDFSTTGFPTGFDDALKPALPVEQTTLAGSLPDVTTLTRMANEFFRAQPGQGFPATVAPTMPGAQELTPNFETRLPGFGMPLPSMPAVPSAGTIPIAPDVTGLSTATPEMSPFTMGPAAAMSLPAAAPIPEAGMLQHDPRSAAAGLPVSPFSLPMPQFGASFQSFEAGIPALPPLPPLRTEDDAKSVLTAGSPFYFLEHARGFSGARMAPSTEFLSQPASSPSLPMGTLQQDPQNVAGVSPFSLPMPEFDRALFPFAT